MTSLQPELRASRAGPLLVVLLTAAAYAGTIFSSFHFDDYAIFADPAVTSRDGWWRVFRLEQTRPLTYFTFWLNYRLGGAEPRGYHALNLALHVSAIAAAWMVFRLLWRGRRGAAPAIGSVGAPKLAAELQRRAENAAKSAQRPRRPLSFSGEGSASGFFHQPVTPDWAALVATGIFALHPLQTEAVAYVFARATLLATLCCLLAWKDWLAGRHWRAAAWFLLGLLSKEECAAFPAVLWLVDWARGRWERRSWPPLIVMTAAAAVAGARLLYVASHLRGTGIARAAGIAPAAYAMTQPRVVLRYLALWLVPLRQNFDHDIRIGAGVAATIGLLALVALALWQVRRGGVWLLGAMVLLAPTSSVIPLADLMFEHRMYLPMVSLAALAAILLERVPRSGAAMILLIFTMAAWSRGRVWANEETLWSDAAAKSPRKVRPKLQLARAVAQKDPQRAEALLLEARRLEPSNAETYTQMGSLLLDQRDPYGALEEFNQALRLRPGSPDARSNRGTALFLLGRMGEAEGEFAEALRVDPCHANARHNLALLYRTRGEEAGARAAEVGPGNCGATNERE